MKTLILTLIGVIAVVATLVWLINQISFGPPILKQLLILLVIVVAIVKVFGLL